ncbi:MAG: VF530 family protein [Ghiorsea sp.]
MSEQNNIDPMHGMTLEKILNALVAYYGWGELGIHVKVRCFNNNPSVKSSLAFLRKTPWARTKVEALYLEMLDEKNGVHNNDSPWPNVP